MKKVYFDGILEMGSSIKDAMVVVSDDWTMTELTKAIKEAGYTMFKTNTMKRYAKLI